MTDASPIANAVGVTPRDARVTTILLVGRVSTGTRDDLCRVRNISSGGMRIETLAPVDIGQHIEVELKNCVTVRSEVVWRGPAEAGVRFETPLDIEQFLAPSVRSNPAMGGRTTRSPRLSARCPIAVRYNGRIMPGMLTDVSQGGAQIQAKGVSGICDHVILYIPGLGARRAVIQWVRDDGIGVSFNEKLGFADLAQWLASEDRFAPAPPQSVS